MQKQREITLSIPEAIYRHVERIASDTQRDVKDVMLDTLANAFISSDYPENPQRAAIKAEIVAFETMHAELVKHFLGQYVAIYQGKLVDYDADPIAIHQRITEKYPGEAILTRKVGQDVVPVLKMRSPRFHTRS